MVKENTEITLQDGNTKQILNFSGGVPLSKGDIVNFHADNSDASVQYEVVDKTIDYYVQGEENVMNITYLLVKR